MINKNLLFISICFFTTVLSNNTLQKIKEYCAHKWQLHNLQKIEYATYVDNDLTTSYSEVYQKKVVLKVCSPSTYQEEKKALRYFKDSNSHVQMIDCDDEHHAILLEYLPGPRLDEYFPEQDDEAIIIVANLIKKMHVNAKNSISNNSTMRIWLNDFIGHKNTQIPEELLTKAKEILVLLMNTQRHLYVLHGDLHYENIMFNGTSWVAIDPYSEIAELEHEIVAPIVCPLIKLFHFHNVEHILECRVEKYSELFKFENERIWQWIFVRAIYSACWLEKNNAATYSKNAVELFDCCIKLAQIANKHLPYESV